MSGLVISVYGPHTHISIYVSSFTHVFPYMHVHLTAGASTHHTNTSPPHLPPLRKRSDIMLIGICIGFAHWHTFCLSSSFVFGRNPVVPNHGILLSSRGFHHFTSSLLVGVWPRYLPRLQSFAQAVDGVLGGADLARWKLPLGVFLGQLLWAVVGGKRLLTHMGVWRCLHGTR